MCCTVLKLSVWPYPANGEIVQLDVLNDLIQQPVCHGVKICKRVGLQRKKKKNSSQHFTKSLKAPPENACCQFSPAAVHYGTWFLSDMRKSSLDPGSPNSMKVLTSRRSALFPGSIEKITGQTGSGSALRVRINHLREPWNMFYGISIQQLHSEKWYLNSVGHTRWDYMTFTLLIWHWKLKKKKKQNGV